ncbi:MAG: efflux RND transporter permease subunit [Planctomycetota bacterium]|nr:MAG: efflux RND transporter permease subunit [Planctomycetota bacterium]
MKKIRPQGLGHLIWFCLDNPLITVLLLLGILAVGLYVLPFPLPEVDRYVDRGPVPVDAIPDIGENQQIVFTEWPGRSPQDVEDQISYPLTVSLQGVPGVKSIRSYSMFGFSSIYIIFEDDVDFYWSRSRVLERLSVASKDLPEGVTPVLGPDATALGQVFWYTLEGEGFSLQELRTIQDWYVRYALQSSYGISEVTSIGGYVKEYQIDVDPAKMWKYKIKLQDIFKAVRRANIDVGARTIEVNGVEYVVRGIGFVKKVEDVENVVIKEVDNIPIYVKNVARVKLGPALRRGALDKEGAEVVGGVVVVRYGVNPLKAIEELKKKIAQIEPGLPQKKLPDGRISKVKIVPFYDRTGLIYETLDTLKEALMDETMITIVVILLFLLHLRSSMVVSLSLPLGILVAFIFMKIYKVDSNIMSLSGIAIAIGTMVDMGIIMTENIVRHLEEAPPEKSRLLVIYEAAYEVGGAILTAISTTIISFLPIFFMEGPEGKLFKPLAFTKTFALFGSVLVALLFNPFFCYLLFPKEGAKQKRQGLKFVLMIVFALFAFKIHLWLGGALLLYLGYKTLEAQLNPRQKQILGYVWVGMSTLAVLFLMSKQITPMGKNTPFLKNFLIISIPILLIISLLRLFTKAYPYILVFLLNYKKSFMAFPIMIMIWGLVIWRGFENIFAPVVDSAGLSSLKKTATWKWLAEKYPKFGEEFMPRLDEGSYLYMPITMPHGSIGSTMEIMRKQDIALSQIPEIEMVVGKLGRVESPLDPAPVSMIETIILYKPEFKYEDRHLFDIPYKGKIPTSPKSFFIEKFKNSPYPLSQAAMVETVEENQHWKIQDGGEIYHIQRHPNALKVRLKGLIRQWRPNIRTKEDIWNEILKATEVPGATTAPKLQPIETRIVMLQTGMRAPMGVKVKGKNLKEIEQVGLQIEKYLKEVKGVKASAVNADRIIGKPYLEFEIHRDKIARYGVNIRDVQDIIEMAIGGKKITTTVEGRERYHIIARYKRELRDSIEEMQRILVPARNNTQIPLSQVTTLRYVRGPQVIKSEDTFLVGYVLFDKEDKYSEVEVVENAQKYLQEKIRSGEFKLPLGTTYEFTGTYENQVRAAKRLMILVPTSILIIFLLIYLQFRSVALTLIVFTAIPVALSGGFILLWLYKQPWFLDTSVFGVPAREMFHIRTYNLSVAVWVGFIALFGVATDDGVVMGTYLQQSFRSMKIDSLQAIRQATIFAGCRRIRPCLMTVATTVLALVPILLSSGKGSDVMIPMALPTVGGLSIVLITLFVVPVCYCGWKELLWKWNIEDEHFDKNNKEAAK